MQINFKNKELNEILKFQEGGEMPAPEAAPAPEAQQGASPEEQIMMACQQAVETQDCGLALQVCQAVMQMLGGAPQEAPQEVPADQEPVYRMGGKLSRYIKK